MSAPKGFFAQEPVILVHAVGALIAYGLVLAHEHGVLGSVSASALSQQVAPAIAAALLMAQGVLLRRFTSSAVGKQLEADVANVEAHGLTLAEVEAALADLKTPTPVVPGSWPVVAPKAEPVVTVPSTSTVVPTWTIPGSVSDVPAAAADAAPAGPLAPPGLIGPQHAAQAPDAAPGA